jgi:tRNA U34 5-methylaminomethyl-2-thiouridine-forming methyltransferase MnmC
VISKKSENGMLRIILTEDGSHTIYHPEINDHYHSIHGAFSESLHVYIRSGFSYHPSANVSILEVGFGTGLNVLLTLKQALEEKRKVIYHSVDKFVLPADITDCLNYTRFFEGINPGLFSAIHRLSWDSNHELSGFFHFRKILADINDLELTERYDIVYFDAFGPDKQPDMWTEDIFRKIYNAMNPGGLLTTYSSKGAVKRRFQQCGFIVEKIPGPPGKREMLRCLKQT